MKIRKCCQNCKHYACCDEEDGDYVCELSFDGKTPRDELGDYWESYDKTDCKHFEMNLDKLAEVYVIDEELKQDDR
jgi:hypothetical protein